MTGSEILQFYVRLTIMTYKVSLSKSGIKANKTDDQKDKVIIQPPLVSRGSPHYITLYTTENTPQ